MGTLFRGVIPNRNVSENCSSDDPLQLTQFLFVPHSGRVKLVVPTFGSSVVAH